jgi:hypothetical protein
MPIDSQEDVVSAAHVESFRRLGADQVGSFDFEELLDTLAGDVASVWL